MDIPVVSTIKIFEITNMTERPSKEWLLSFGIEEAPRDVYENVIVVE